MLPRDLELEQRFAFICAKQEAKGVLVDQGKLEALIQKLTIRRAEIVDEWDAYAPKDAKPEDIAKLTAKGLADFQAARGGWLEPYVTPATGKSRARFVVFNPGSRHHLARLMMERYGWKPTKFTEADSIQLDEKVLEGLSYPEAKLAGESLMVTKRLGTLIDGKEAWVTHIQADGRIHGRLVHIGTVTFRCAHSSPNLGNPTSIRKAYGREMRACFVAPPGYSLVGCDASGLEVRCLAHYMAAWDKGAYARVVLEGDIHALTQEIVGIPDRDVAKTFIYALLYGAGDAKLASIVGYPGHRARGRMLKGLPAFGALTEAVKASAARGYLIGLDGRHVPVRHKHAALNTLLQSAGAIVMKQATVNFHESLSHLKNGVDDALRCAPEGSYDFAQVLHVHDEFQTEVRKGLEEEVGQQAQAAIRRAGEQFEFKCPLDGEWKSGASWSATH